MLVSRYILTREKAKFNSIQFDLRVAQKSKVPRTLIRNTFGDRIHRDAWPETRATPARSNFIKRAVVNVKRRRKRLKRAISRAR